MKNFTTVQKWLDTNPSPEVTAIVLKTINRSATSEMKKEILLKTRELQKLELAIKAMEDLDLAVPENITDQASAHRERISELKQWLPPSVNQSRA
jgi:hypothetical protein